MGWINKNLNTNVAYIKQKRQLFKAEWDLICDKTMKGGMGFSKIMVYYIKIEKFYLGNS